MRSTHLFEKSVTEITLLAITLPQVFIESFPMRINIPDFLKIHTTNLWLFPSGISLGRRHNMVYRAISILPVRLGPAPR